MDIADSTQECAANPYMICALTNNGGHCGFLEGMLPFGHGNRMTRTVLEYFEAVLELDRESIAHSVRLSPDYPRPPTTSAAELLGNHPRVISAM